jgi:hypothetical protein
LSITADIVVTVTDGNDLPVMVSPTIVNVMEGDTLVLKPETRVKSVLLSLLSR